jgi:spermidine synthase
MFLKALVLMLPPTILMGASFPVATSLFATHISTVSRKVSLLYSWNTIACIIGSIITGFFLIPYTGFEKSLYVMIVLNIGSGLVLLAAEPNLRRSIKLPAVIAIFVVASLSTAFMPHSIIRTMHKTIFHEQEKTLYYQETPYGVVEILQNPTRRRLLQDDLDLAGTSMAYLSSQKPLGHLPLLLHPHPQNVFIIGFGGGGASYAASTYPQVKHIDIAELNRSIINAAPFFSSINHDVLTNPKCSLAIDDGRHFLLTTKSRYDVISVDLLWPQTAGAGSLYTKEFYQLCFNRLNEKGLMVEWIHTGLIPETYLKTILNTVKKIFPYVSLWTSRSFGHLFLVVSKDSHFQIDYQSFSERIKYPLVAKDLSEISCDKPDVFLSYYIADGAALDNIIGGENAINTDNLPIIEYKLPFSRKWSWIDNAVGIMHFKQSVLPIIQNIDSLESRKIKQNEQTMAMVLESKIDISRGDQLDAIFLCTDAIRTNPSNPEANAWYAELKQTMKCLSDSGKAPPNILSAFDTTDIMNNP